MAGFGVGRFRGSETTGQEWAAFLRERKAARDFIGVEPTETGLRIFLNDVRADATGALDLSLLDVGGVSRRDDIQLGSNLVNDDVATGSNISAGGILAYVDADTLVPGEIYLLQYTIDSLGDGANPYFQGTNAPFDTSYNPLPTGVGSHALLVSVKDGFSATGSVELMRSATSYINLSAVSLTRAEWSLDLPEQREWIENTHPETLSGIKSTNVLGLAEGGEIAQGDRFELQYEITQSSNVENFFIPDSSAFYYTALDLDPGTHRVELTANQNTTVRDFIRLTGDVTCAWITLRKIEDAGNPTGDGRAIDAAIAIGDQSFTMQSAMPLAGVHYVAANGNDITGTGAPDAPYRNPQMAADISGTADTIYLRPGAYDPVQVKASGIDPDQRHRLTALPGEYYQAEIMGHNLDGSFYQGVWGRAVSHVAVSRLRVTNCLKEGILFEGQQPEDDIDGEAVPVATDILIEWNRVKDTGSSSIMVVGHRFDQRYGVGNAETEVTRTQTVVIRRNDCSHSNVANDLTENFTNADGNPGGNNEVISVGAALDDVLIEHNWVHDSLQYGIDPKAGVSNAIIRNNYIWNVAHHAIYFDTGRRFVRGVQAYDNVMWNCRNGVVLAREADYDYDDPPADLADFDLDISDVDIYNNVALNMDRYGLLCYAHNGDVASGRLERINIVHNTFINCGQVDTWREEMRLAGWTDPEFLAETPEGSLTVSDFVAKGNVAYRDTDDANHEPLHDEYSGHDGFTVEENFATGADPLFMDHNAVPQVSAGDFPDITVPDFRLRAGTAADGLVNGLDASVFGRDMNGELRAVPAQAGALAKETSLFLIVGQSNSVGTDQFDNGEPYPDWVLDVDSDGSLVHPEATLSNASQGTMSPMLQFAIDYAAANPEKHIVIAAMGVGETGLVSNRWNPGDDLYEAAVLRVNDAMAAYPDMKMAGIAVQMGENDRSNPTFAEQFDTMITSLRSDIAAADDTTPVIIGQTTGSWSAPEKEYVDAVLLQTPLRLPYSAVAPSDGTVGKVGDDIHFSAADMRLMGARYATALVEAEGYVPSAPAGITDLEVQRGDGEISLAWTVPSSPSQPIGSYVFEVNDGTGYVAATGIFEFVDAGATGFGAQVRAAVTGLTNDIEIMVRVAAVNSLGQGGYSNEVSTTPTTLDPDRETEARAHWYFGSDNEDLEDLINAATLSPIGGAATLENGYAALANTAINGLDTGITDRDGETRIIVARIPSDVKNFIEGNLQNGSGQGSSLFHNNGAFRLHNSAGNAAVALEPSIVDAWVFMAVAEDNAETFTWINGTEATKAADGDTVSDRTHAVGNGYYDADGFTGSIDVAEYIYFDSKLTSSEIADVHARSVARLANRGITLI